MRPPPSRNLWNGEIGLETSNVNIAYTYDPDEIENSGDELGIDFEYAIDGGLRYGAGINVKPS